jgi:hypothetical protein
MKWIAGVSVVAAVVFALATIAIPAQTIVPDQAVLKLFPAETQGVAFVDLAGLRNTPLGQEVMAQGGPLAATRVPKLQDFINATGFNFQQDVDRVTVGRLDNRRAMFIIQARFDKFKVERYLADHVTRLDTYMGRSIYEDRDLDFGVTFIDELVIAGYTDAVKKAVEQASLPASSIALRSDLMAAIRNFESGSQVWAVGDFRFNELPVAQLPSRAVGAGPILEVLRTLQGGTYQMRVDSNIHAKATANFTSTENAKTLADLSRGMIALVKTQVAAQNPDLLHALDGVQVSNSGTQIVVNIDEPGDLVKRLRKLRQQRPTRRLPGD